MKIIFYAMTCDPKISCVLLTSSFILIKPIWKHLEWIIKNSFHEIDLSHEQISELIFISWKEVAVAAASEEQEECNLSLLVMVASTQALLYMNWCMLSVRSSYALIYNIDFFQDKNWSLRSWNVNLSFAIICILNLFYTFRILARTVTSWSG